jgi:hypothetical protein
MYLQCSEKQRSVAANLALAWDCGLAEFQKKCTFFLEKMDDLANLKGDASAALTMQLGDGVPAPQLAQLVVSMLQARQQQLDRLAEKAQALLGVWESECFDFQAEDGGSAAVTELVENVRTTLYQREDCGDESIYPTANCSYGLPFIAY